MPGYTYQAMNRLRAVALLVGMGLPAALTFACGGRTGLLLPGTSTDKPQRDSGSPGEDAATEDAGEDVVEEPDTAIPPIDANLPDVPVVPMCADASDTLIYAVTTSNTLLRFNPTSAQFAVIGVLDCQDPYGRNPFSMAVDRGGAAYVLYSEYDNGTFPPPPPGNIFRVDLNDATCSPTAYIAGQQGFTSFGMAFVADTNDLNETLYVASDDAPGRLGAIDEATLTLSLVGQFNPPIQGAELTGTGDGRLFGFYAATPLGPTSVLAQIDKASATVIGATPLPTVNQGGAWAFAFYGGAFYLFTSPDDATSIVTRYDPTTGSLTNVATYPEEIDGAGVSTCAPER
jgi:hypothetical protein